MKAIMVKNTQIVSLENVREVNLCESGSGAKSNPYHWWINVRYTDNKEVNIDNDFSNKKDAIEVLEAIFEKLTLDK